MVLIRLFHRLKVQLTNGAFMARSAFNADLRDLFYLRRKVLSADAYELSHYIIFICLFLLVCFSDIIQAYPRGVTLPDEAVSLERLRTCFACLA